MCGVSCVLIIDDHPVVQQGCAQILKEAGATEILVTGSLTHGFHLYRTAKPDLIIVDLALSSGTLGGLSFIRRLRARDQKIPLLVFTMHSDPMIVSHAIKAGANGYVLKDASAEEFLKSCKMVSAGKPYLSQELASEVAFSQAKTGRNPLERLSTRELQTLAYVAEGKPYALIAQSLNVSYKTVANTITQLKAKLEVRTLSELIALGIEHFSNIARFRDDQIRRSN